MKRDGLDFVPYNIFVGSHVDDTLSIHLPSIRIGSCLMTSVTDVLLTCASPA